MPLKITQKDLTDEIKYPACKTKQGKCLIKLLNRIKSNRPQEDLAKQGKCHPSTISKALKKKLKPQQAIIGSEIAKRWAKKYKNAVILTELCPEYAEWPDDVIAKILKIKK